jgi:hypothetical protein
MRLQKNLFHFYDFYKSSIVITCKTISFSAQSTRSYLLEEFQRNQKPKTVAHRIPRNQSAVCEIQRLEGKFCEILPMQALVDGTRKVRLFGTCGEATCGN